MAEEMFLQCKIIPYLFIFSLTVWQKDCELEITKNLGCRRFLIPNYFKVNILTKRLQKEIN